MRPVIGVIASYEEEEGHFWLRDDYVQVVEKAGGLPIILPVIREEMIADCLEICSGFLFTGGGDIDPVYWGETPGPDMGRIDPERDRFEMLLARYAHQRGKPVLGICRGCQVLNVAAGGSLFQHISSSLCHQQNAPRNYVIHDIVVMEDSLLIGVLGRQTLRVNSFHHQAVHKTAPGLKASAWAPDGVVEAVESEMHPFWLGVQWHPEALTDQLSDRLFRAFVKAAGLNRKADNASVSL